MLFVSYPSGDKELTVVWTWNMAEKPKLDIVASLFHKHLLIICKLVTSKPCNFLQCLLVSYQSLSMHSINTKLFNLSNNSSTSVNPVLPMRKLGLRIIKVPQLGHAEP